MTLKSFQKINKSNIKDKNGLIKIFCECYNIYDVINEFLPTIYIKGNEKNKFSYYKSKDDYNFLVLDGGKYGYSQYDNDPAKNILCDSYDLVRLHKFYNDDEKDSYKKMMKFILNDEKVRVALNKENLIRAKENFKNLNIDFKESESCDKENIWLNLLESNDNGGYINSLKNISIILSNDLNLKDKIRLNEFINAICIKEDLPWHKVKDKYNGDLWGDCDDSYLRLYFEEVYKITSPFKILDGLTVVSNEKKYHPIKDYIKSLEWDKEERLDRLFCNYYGAEDSEYVRAVTRKSLVAAIARVFNPGVKFDYMVILTGGQGIGKSHIFEVLGKSWYSDSLTTVRGKEAYEQLQGVWIVEMAELSALKGAEADEIKLFISKSEDIYRNAYGRRVKKHPRQCVFFGTSNKEEFLVDSTGNRRFWPIQLEINKKTKDVWKDLDSEIDQIWAEAYYRYKEGEELYIKDKIIEKALIEQKKHMISDSREGLIIEFLNKPVPKNWNYKSVDEKIEHINRDEVEEDYVLRDKVCSLEIWVELFNGDIKMFNRGISRDIIDILKKIDGWNSYERGDGRLRFGSQYGLQKAFVREVINK